MVDPHKNLRRTVFPLPDQNSSTWSISIFIIAYTNLFGKITDVETLSVKTTWDILNKYPQDYKVIFVGDAAMSPYEITIPGGSVEHWNEESGHVWMQRILENLTKRFGLIQFLSNTELHALDQMIQEIMHDPMFPLTLKV